MNETPLTMTADDNSNWVDARGLMCPEPVVMTRLALKTATPGTLLTIRVTDPLAPLDLEALCARTGDLFCGQQLENGGEFVVSVRKALRKD